MRRLRHHLRRHGSDTGASIVELAVVTLVSGIVLLALGGLFSSSLKASRTASSRVTTTADARLAMDAIAQRLRVATRNAADASSTSAPTGRILVEARADTVTFWASLTPAGQTPGPLAPSPSRVTYRVDPVQRCVRETITPSGGPARSRCLAYGSGNLGFAYFQVAKRPTAYAPSPPPVSPGALPLPSGGALSEADLAKVGSVSVALSWNAERAPAGSRALTLSTQVLLVNELNEEVP